MAARGRIEKPSDATIEAASAALRAGDLVALPTETVYGLAGDATNDRAVAAIFAAKDRPRFNPLIAHFPHAAGAASAVQFDERAERLAARFWPGPLTLVLPRRADCGVSLLASAGLDSLAVRVPAHPVAQALLAALGRPVAAPSANRSGRVSPTEAAHVVAELGDRVAMILDGGPCRLGIESTIIDLSRRKPLLLRQGAIAQETLAGALDDLEVAAPPAQGERPAAPGMLESHYAPDLPIRLEAADAATDEALLAFGPDAPRAAGAVFNLSERSDLVEAAANLFAMLRQADVSGRRAIAVMPIPERDLGRAINDRLRRAAAPRR